MLSGLRWFALGVGCVVLAATALSVIGTLVVPRGISSPIARTVDRAVDAVFHAVCRPLPNYISRDRLLAWQAPASLLVRLLVWVAMFVLGYTLVLLPLVPGPPWHALSEAGSSTFTLGYSAPTNAPSTIVDYFAAYTGLLVVALQIGYLPTLYSAFNRRETEVTLLISRAGVPAWGPELLARTRYGIRDVDGPPQLGELFDVWQRWSAELAESHTTYPTLARLRSPRPLSHWLLALLAVLDAAALHLSLTPSAEPRLQARLCLRMGFTALQQIGRTLRLPVIDEPDPDLPLQLSYEQFAEAVTMLRDVGYPVEVPAEQAWPEFRGWRVNYETVALALAKAVDAPPGLWSGDRRWPSSPMPPLRPGDRRAGGGNRAVRPRAEQQPP